MRFFRLGSWGLLVLGCGAAPKPVAVPKVVPVVAQESDGRRPYAEVTALPKPMALDGAWLRVASLSHSLGELPSLVKDLPGLTLFKDLVEGRGGLVPADVAAVIDPAQPIDLVFPMAGTELPALSFRVRSAEAIEQGAAGLTLTRIEPGIWNIGSVGAEPSEPSQPDEDEAEPDEEEQASDGLLEGSGNPMACRLLHLPSPVGFRVLCSRGGPPTPAAQAFLLAPEQGPPFKGDAHLELAGPGYQGSLEHLLQVVTAKVNTDPAPGRNAGQDIVRGMFGALLEHERLRLDLSLHDLRAEAELDLDFPRQCRTPGLATWLEQSEKAPLPSGLARLTPDHQLTIGTNLGPGVMSAILTAFGHDLDESTITSDAQRREVLESLQGVLPQDGRMTFAMGMDIPAALQALDGPAVQLADDADKPLAPAAVQELQAALGGWFVIGMDEPPARYLAAVKRAYRVGRQKSKTRPGHEEKNRRSTSELVRLSGAPRGLPKDTLHVVSQERPERKYEPPADGSSPPLLPYDEHLLVVPDGPRVWIVVARNEAVAVKQAQALLARSASQASQNQAPGVLSATMQVALFGVSDVSFDSKAQRAAARKLLGHLNSAPEQARLAVPLGVQVLPREDGAGFRLHFRSAAALDQLLGQAIALMPETD
jgi:hypothetical protein